MFEKSVFARMTVFSKSSLRCLTPMIPLSCSNSHISPCTGLFLATSDCSKRAALYDRTSQSNTSPLLFCRRYEQYQQTSEIYGNLHRLKNRKASQDVAAKWILKSTKEYVEESNTKLQKAKAVNVTPQSLAHPVNSIADRRKEMKEMVAKAREEIDIEVDRLRTEKLSRIRKMYNFFKRQGRGFVIFYCIAYVVPFILLYLGLASGVLKKEWLFDIFLMMFDKYVDRDYVYSKIEKFDTYINVGCAFVLNDILEIIRLPLVISGFFVFRRYLTRSDVIIGKARRPRNTIFRFSAPESEAKIINKK